MESSYNNTYLDSSYIGGTNSILDIYEDPEVEVSQRKELEELIKNVPYSLSVALIKITQLHNYEPMDIDTLYQKILPAFPLLRRNDGSKYQSHSLHTVRSAMVSNKLYTKNPQGKYILNVTNAIKIIKSIKVKKKVNNKESGIRQNNTIDNNIKNKKNIADNTDTKESFINIDYDSQNIDTSNITDNNITIIKAKKPKIKKVKDTKEIVNKNKIEKYEKSFSVLKKLLSESEKDKMLYSQIHFDFTNLNELSQFSENKINNDKLVGILSVFKFFKPFLERSLNSVHCQENIMTKLNELSNEVQNMGNLYKFEEE